ncbi:unnamed protein product [Malus baccata var. baccata]
MLRWMCGHTRNDKIRNDDIQGKVGVAKIEGKMRENQYLRVTNATNYVDLNLMIHFLHSVYQEMSSTMDLYTLKSTSHLPALFRSSFIFSGDGSIALS